MVQAQNRDRPYPNFIREHIKKQGYRVQDIAEKTGIPRRTLTNYLSGLRPIPREYLKKLARTLHCSINELIPEVVDQTITGASRADGAIGEENLCGTSSTNLQRDSFLVSLLQMLPAEQTTLLISLIESGINSMAHDQLKRETLQKLATALGIAVTGQHIVSNPEPWERLMMARKRSSALNKETLDRFERLIAECWALANNNQLEAAEGILSSFLPTLLVLPQQKGRVAFLSSHGLRLQSVLVHHRLQLTEKVNLYEEAVDYARLAEDATTLIASLMELAVAYKYAGQLDKWFKTLLEALYYTPQVPSLMQSPAYFKSALAFAHYGRKKEAEMYIQMASEVFPDHPESESGYALADTNLYTFSRDAGRALLAVGKTADAWGAFETYKEHVASGPLIPERLRLEIVNGQSKAAIQENNLDKYAYFLADGLSGAVALGSKKRFEEAYTIFKEDMPVAWLSSSKIQSIIEQYRLDRA